MSSGYPRSLAGRPLLRSDLLGQVLTPQPLAVSMANLLLRNRPSHGVCILDPSSGPATFPRVLAEAGQLVPQDKLTLYELDDELAAASRHWAIGASCEVAVLQEDYLESAPARSFDYAILNPPYVRQEWIDKKKSYRANFQNHLKVDVPGASNLYVYFLVKTVLELRGGGEFVCITYDSWQATRYGTWLLEFLNRECEPIQVLPCGPQPFAGRLIGATIIHGIKRQSPKLESVIAASKTSIFSNTAGFRPITDFFNTRRGLRLKQANFFLCDKRQVSIAGATPFIKKARGLSGLKVPADHPEEALLLRPGDTKPEVLRELHRRLKMALAAPDLNIAILTWYRERRDTWFIHPPAPFAPILFNYYLRAHPHHIYNQRRRAYADNFYGLTLLRGGSNGLQIAIAILNSSLANADILAQARDQGSGLAKVQLFEYRRVYIADWEGFSRRNQRRLESLGAELIDKGLRPQIVRRINGVIAAEIDLPAAAVAAADASYIAMENQATRKKR